MKQKQNTCYTSDTRKLYKQKQEMCMLSHTFCSCSQNKTWLCFQVLSSYSTLFSVLAMYGKKTCIVGMTDELKSYCGKETLCNYSGRYMHTHTQGKTPKFKQLNLLINQLKNSGSVLSLTQVKQLQKTSTKKINSWHQMENNFLFS